MNKEEFYNIVKVEIEKLLEEKKEAYATVRYYDAINQDGLYDTDTFYQEQRRQAEYKLQLVEAKTEKVKELLGYPLYVRITSLTYTELEEYKKQKIKELENEIEKLRQKQQVEQNEVENLKNRQKGLISKLSNENDSFREEAIKEAREIFEELKKYNNSSIEQKIKELKNEIEKLRNKSIDDIRDELKEQVPNNGKHSTTATRGSNGYTKFISEIAEDYDKTKEFVDLALSKEDMKKQAENRINASNDYQKLDDIIGKLPESFVDLIPFDINEYKLDKDTIKKLASAIQLYEEKCNKIKENFVSNFCTGDYNELSNDLIKLVQLKNESIFELLEPDKFKPYEKRYSSYAQADLVSLFRQKEELEKKIIKTDNTKLKLKKIEEDIKLIEQLIFTEIIESYISDLEELFYIFGSKDILGHGPDIIAYKSNFNIRDLADTLGLKNMFENTETIKKIINTVMSQFESINKNLNEMRKILSTENSNQKEEEKVVDEIDNKVKSLTDVEFNTDIPYMGTTNEEIVDFIINNAAKQKQDEVATKIEEAKESQITDLDGLNPDYLEELRALKETIKSLKEDEKEQEKPFSL